MLTLQQIKDSLPKYRYLTPGVDVWREGDEYFSKYDGDWIKAVHMSTKILCEMGTLVSYRAVRRPIPDEVLENQAFWVLYNKLATVDPNLSLVTLKNDKPEEYAVWSKFPAKAIPLLGGEQNIIKQLSAGDLYNKWLGEQLT